jgi:hypothetical protein
VLYADNCTTTAALMNGTAMKIRTCIPLSIFSFVLPASGGTASWAAELAVTDRQADFKEFVQDVADNYAWPDSSVKPWLTLEERYAAAVKSASTQEALAAVEDPILARGLAQLGGSLGRR